MQGVLPNGNAIGTELVIAYVQGKLNPVMDKLIPSYLIQILLIHIERW